MNVHGRSCMANSPSLQHMPLQAPIAIGVQDTVLFRSIRQGA